MKLKKSLAISDTGFIFDPATGDSFTVNLMGMEIIQLLKEGKDPDAISKIITKRYDVDRNSFERYFLDFTGVLKQLQLMTSDE